MPTSVSILPPVAAPTRLLHLHHSPADAVEALRPSISSQSLLRGGRELVIHHQGSEYHLRLTRNDKLILTK